VNGTFARVLLVAAMGVPLSGAAAPVHAATRLFIRNHVNSNDVRDLVSWNGVLAAATTGGLVTVAPPAGPPVKIVAAPGGLPSNLLLALASSPSGDLWIGTVDAGLARLAPGGTWRRTLTTFDGLPTDAVQALDRAGDSVWVGTSGGVALFTESPVNARVTLRRSDTRASTAGALVSDDVRAFAVFRDTLWAGTAGGLSAFAGGAWIDRTALFGGAVNDLLVVDGSLWIATATGPRAYADGVLLPVDPGHTGASLALAAAPGGFYSGSDGLGVYRRSGSGWTSTGPGLPFGNTNALGFAPDGALWSGQPAGLARYDGGTWTAVPTQGPWIESLEKVAVRNGEAWFTPGNQRAAGVGAGQILRTDGNVWSLITNESTGGALQAASTFAILAAKDGALWLGHCCGGGAPQPREERFQPDSGTWVYPGPTNILAFGQAPDGLVYAGSAEFGNGVYVHDPGGALLDSLTPVNTQGSASGTGLSSNNLHAIAFDARGVAWIGTAALGVDRWDGRGTLEHADDIWTHYGAGFPSPSVNAIAVLDTATAFIGTPAGIAIVAGGTLSLSRMDAIHSVIGSVPVQDLARDPRRVVWIGTNAGLGRWDDATQTMERFTTADGLVDDDVHGLAWDESRGILWVATARGVSEIHPQPSGAPALGPGAFAYPNPAGPGAASIRIGGLSGAVTGEVFDAAGSRVRSFRADPVSSAAWDLRDAEGRRAAPGVYLLVVRDGDRVRTLRVAVTR